MSHNCCSIFAFIEMFLTTHNHSDPFGQQFISPPNQLRLRSKRCKCTGMHNHVCQNARILLTSQNITHQIQTITNEDDNISTLAKEKLQDTVSISQHSKPTVGVHL